MARGLRIGKKPRHKVYLLDSTLQSSFSALNLLLTPHSSYYYECLPLISDQSLFDAQDGKSSVIYQSPGSSLNRTFWAYSL